MDVGGIIGNLFEEYFQDLFPHLERHTDSRDNLPDFFHRSGFWVETKTGYHEWGCRPKKEQVESHRRLKEPVIHAIGFHDFYGAMSLPQKTDRGRKNHLRERMNFTSIVFLGQEIMEGVLRRGQTTNKKGTLDYCMLKPSMLRNIFLDRENFTFNGVKASSAEEFFGFDRRNYMFLGEVNDRTLPLDYAFALHHKREARALDYFMGMCLGATK